MIGNYDDFYREELSDLVGARIDSDKVAYILHRFENWTLNHFDKEDESSSERLWRIVTYLKQFGYEPFSGQTIEDFLGDLIRHTSELKSELDSAVTQLVGVASRAPVAEDIHIYTMDGEEWQDAAYYAHQRKPNRLGRLYIHSHQPGRPCDDLCREETKAR